MAKVFSRGSRRKEDYDSLWLISFADLMVQLMAFFAVVYALTSQDQAKMKAVLAAVQNELGVKHDGVLPGGTGLAADRAADLEKLLGDLKPNEGGLAGVRMQVVTFRSGLLFAEGGVELDPSFEPLLKRVSELATQYPGYTLVCEGHAAPGEKGRGRGQDALELSGLRAQATVRDLVARGMDPALLAAEAHGDAQLEGNPASVEGRALERKVRFRFQKAMERP